MMFKTTYQIVLRDNVTNELEKIMDFQESINTPLEEKLYQLQEGYAAEDDVVHVKDHIVESDKYVLRIAIADSGCDYSYCAVREIIRTVDGEQTEDK